MKINCSIVHFLLFTFSPLDPCAARDCEHFARCVSKADDSTICTCPEDCPTVRKSVCGSDNVTYKNDCEMRREMCKAGKTGKLKKIGVCGKLVCS